MRQGHPHTERLLRDHSQGGRVACRVGEALRTDIRKGEQGAREGQGVARAAPWGLDMRSLCCLQPRHEARRDVGRGRTAGL